jgi:hypothetical protein
MCSNPALPEGAACDDGTGCASTMCESGACVANPSSPPVDQSYLDPTNASSGFGDQPSSPQSFTVGRTGHLVGIEVAFYEQCNLGAPGNIRLDVIDSGMVVATATLPTSVAPGGCVEPPPLDPCTKGPRTFDLSATPLPVTAGEVLRFDVRTEGLPPPVCTNGRCVTGPVSLLCSTDADCQWVYGLKLVDPGQYPGGSWEFGPPPSTYDLIFKTYVE